MLIVWFFLLFIAWIILEKPLLVLI